MEPIFPWLVIVFVGGLILGSWVQVPWEAWSVVPVILGTLVLLRNSLREQKARLVLTFLFFLLGTLHAQRILPKDLPDDHVARWAGARVDLEGILIRAPERRSGSVRLLMEVFRVYEEGRSQGVPARGKILLTVGRGGGRFQYGDVIRVRCSPRLPPGQANPGTFHWRRYLALRRIYATAFVPNDNFILLIRHGFGGIVRGGLESLRLRLSSLFTKEFPTPAKELLLALVLGEGGALSPRWREVFASLGVSHLLAISGLHVGIVALFVFGLARRALLVFPTLALRVPVEKVSWGLAIPMMLLYGGVAGLGTSTVRSLFMGCFLAAALLWDRLRALPHALSMAALGILLIRPESIYDLSFQLSFLAVMGILYAVPRWMEVFFPVHPLDRLEPRDIVGWRLFRSTVGLALCSTAAFLATLPVILLHFHRLPWVAVPANVVLVPLVGFLALPLALTGSALSLVWPAGGVEILWVSAWLLQGIAQGMSVAAQYLGEGIFLPAPRPWEVAIFYGIFVCLCHFRRVPWTRWGILGLSILLLLIWGVEGLMRERDSTLRVHCISVGNGAAVLVEGPGGYRMLVDAGGGTRGGRDLGELEVAPVLWHRRILRLHRVVLSHPHPDHITGLVSVFRRFPVGELWGNGVFSQSEVFQRLKGAAALKGLHIRSLQRGICWTEGPLRIEVLFPPEEGPLRLGNTASAQINNSSAVLRLSMGAVSFLIPGDIEKEAEAWLYGRGGIRSTVLVAPHHGSKTSNSEAFLRAVRPRCVVFSTKAGRGSLLSPVVRERYKRLGVKSFHTGEDGMVSFMTDGRELSVMTYKTRRRERIRLFAEERGGASLKQP